MRCSTCINETANRGGRCADCLTGRRRRGDTDPRPCIRACGTMTVRANGVCRKCHRKEQIEGAGKKRWKSDDNQNRLIERLIGGSGGNTHCPRGVLRLISREQDTYRVFRAHYLDEGRTLTLIATCQSAQQAEHTARQDYEDIATLEKPWPPIAARLQQLLDREQLIGLAPREHDELTELCRLALKRQKVLKTQPNLLGASTRRRKKSMVKK